MTQAWSREWRQRSIFLQTVSSRTNNLSKRKFYVGKNLICNSKHALDLLSFRYSVHRTLRLQIQRLNDQVNWKELVEPSRLSSDWLKISIWKTFCGDCCYKESMYERMILCTKKKNNFNKLFVTFLLSIQFHERNSWTECTLFFLFLAIVIDWGARLSKSVSLTSVRFDPLSSHSLSDWKSFSAIDLLCKERFIDQTSVKQCLHCSSIIFHHRKKSCFLIIWDIVTKIKKQTNRFTWYLYIFFRFPVG